MPDIGSPAGVKEDLERVKSENALEISDLRWAMNDARGRRLVQRFINKSGLYGEIFSPHGSTQSRNIGRRDLGIWLHELLEAHCPNLYLLMKQEHQG